MNRPNIEKAYNFSNKSIGNIYITGAGFIRREFKGASPDSPYGWDEFVWASSPTRSDEQFRFSNLDSIKVGLIPRCEINIKYMNYDDYRDFRKILKERHFQVEFFNTDECKWVTRDMYASGQEKSKFYSLNMNLIGVIDFKIKLVGTNNDLEDYLGNDGRYVVKGFNITYDGTDQYDEHTEYAGQITITNDPQNIFINTDKHLAYFVTKDNNGNITGKYLPNQSITMWKNIKLYPIYE